jgi:hypothetical protein
MRHSAGILTILILMLSVFTFCVKNVSAVQIQDPYQQLLDLQKQARAGDVGAQYLLGFMYAEGQGVAKDPQEALRWYTKAANQGHVDAQLTVAMIYAEGQGVEKNQQKAVEWYTKAAEQGNASVQVILAMLLVNDQQPSSENYVEAYKWALLAEANDKDIAEHKAWLTERMTADQTAESQKRANAFVTRFPASVHLPNDPTGPVKYISEKDGFSLIFPSPPKRTIVQDNERLLAIHYQSIPNDGPVHYNASFQYFKNAKFLDEPSRKTFLDDYIVGRAMFAWQNKIQKKEIAFLGFYAVHFRHIVFSAGTETIHEGLAFFANGDFVSLTCVYPAAITPDPGFNDFVNAFEALDKLHDPNEIQSTATSSDGP